MPRKLFSAGVLLLLAARAAASLHAAQPDGLPLNHPDWKSQIPGAPAIDDPDGDGATSFYEYALGAAPADAVDPHKSGNSPYLSTQTGDALLHFDFVGRQDVVYLFESRTDLSPDAWTTLAWKLGPTPWQVVDPQASLTQDGDFLRFQQSSGRAKLFRLRVETQPTLLNEAQAVRFLRQATFGPAPAEIDELLNLKLDFENWIDAQIALPVTTLTDTAADIPGLAGFPRSFPLGNRHAKGAAWFEAALNAPDQLRQRMAWALAQIIVLGEIGSANNGNLDEWLHYYDLYLHNALGNYRDLLQDVTRSPKMGRYLTYLNNQKERGTRKPDENYAREVMQLFTIGLWELNRDGSLKLDDDGEPIPTYDNEDITEMARVFTGFVLAPDDPNYEDTDQNWIDPMRANENRHDRGEKVLLEGTVLPAGQDTLTDVTQALDALFQHPNTAPFVSLRLIQRLTCSNPSPQYLDRVAAVFEDDGSGARGNLAAVAKAILLDPEARSGAFLVDPTRGKLREPLNRFLQVSRALGLESSRADKVLYLADLQNQLGQYPFRSPTVFNFYEPDFAPAGELRDQDLTAPEFQILDDSTGILSFGVMQRLVTKGLAQPFLSGNASHGRLDLSYEQSLASDAAALVDHLNLLLANNALTETEKTAIVTAVEGLDPSQAQQRVERALVLLCIAPSFNVLQ
ncbi:DUF1800 family protein [Pelagicoccus sp. SDUM812005]|uniref:DUF1800 domain-containing protein n=1 Tax=Pelagicoccus sp. SDUM812005 TaxID=3041257 RepID=UPI0028108A99|nr:DUF1800 family protein [Pelagicoccus sp. SDUM812005]MDQ8180729.1 DUF1800 family protein [Pelagicoccus sp. SDUM812005]